MLRKKQQQNVDMDTSASTAITKHQASQVLQQNKLTATLPYVFIISQVIQTISMIAPPLAPHLFLPRITIVTSNDRDIPHQQLAQV